MLFTFRNCILIVAAILITALTLSAVPHAEDCVQGNGQLAEQQRTLTAFDGVSVDGAFTVTVRVGKELRCTLRGDANLLEQVITQVKNRQLHIGSKKSLCMQHPLEIELLVPGLDQFCAEGVHEIAIHDLDEPTFKVRLTGASSARIGGRSDEFQLEIDGASTLDARSLLARTVTVTASGTSSVLVQVSEALTVTASGVAEILYCGKPLAVTSQLGDLAELAELPETGAVR